MCCFLRMSLQEAEAEMGHAVKDAPHRTRIKPHDHEPAGRIGGMTLRRSRSRSSVMSSTHDAGTAWAGSASASAQRRRAGGAGLRRCLRRSAGRTQPARRPRTKVGFPHNGGAERTFCTSDATGPDGLAATAQSFRRLRTVSGNEMSPPPRASCSTSDNLAADGLGLFRRAITRAKTRCAVVTCGCPRALPPDFPPRTRGTFRSC